MLPDSMLESRNEMQTEFNRIDMRDFPEFSKLKDLYAWEGWLQFPGITTAQMKAVEFLHAKIMAYQGFVNAAGEQTREYKQFTVCLIGKSIEVLAEVGGRGDEGTMAEVFGRDRRQIFIGPRGGMKLANPARFYKNKAGHTCKTFSSEKVRGYKVAYVASMC